MLCMGVFRISSLDRIWWSKGSKKQDHFFHAQTDLNALLDHGIHCVQHSNSCKICGRDLWIGYRKHMASTWDPQVVRSFSGTSVVVKTSDPDCAFLSARFRRWPVTSSTHGAPWCLTRLRCSRRSWPHAGRAGNARGRVPCLLRFTLRYSLHRFGFSGDESAVLSSERPPITIVLGFAAAFVGDFLLYGLRGLRTPRVVCVMKLRKNAEKQDVQISNFQGCCSAHFSLFFIFILVCSVRRVCWSCRICIHMASTSNCV